MKENLRRLQLIMKLTRIDPEWFYSIAVCPGYTSFQGRYNSAVVIELHALGFDSKIDSIGYTVFHRGCIEITLT